MLCPGLSLVGLICTVTVVLLIDGSWGKDMSLTNRGQSIAVRHQQDFRITNLCHRAYLNENEGKRKKFNWIKDLKRVTLKLRLILGKYDQKSEHLNELYKGVANCGLSNCGKYPNVLPENMKPKEFNCKKFKELRDLEKWTSEILSKGYNGSKTYEDQFEELIRFEKSRRFQQRGKNNRSRLTILRELRSEIRLLSVNILEVKSNKTKERLNTIEGARKIASGVLHDPESQTDLKIREWGILQHSKEYLSRFCESLQLVYECWRKSGSKSFSKRKSRILGRSRIRQRNTEVPEGRKKQKWNY